ncbi:MAG: NDP-sugar synthase [Candidatus Hadarchaeales archaeon]
MEAPRVCMILCGGRGRRLGLAFPKVLLELKPNLTILDHQLAQYRKAGLEKAVLLTGFGHEKIEKRYGKKFEDMRIEYVKEEEPAGTLNALRLGMEHVREDAMVSNGDVVAEINLRRMWEEFTTSGALASILITRMRSPYGVIKVRGKRVVEFTEKPLLDVLINGGYYCFSKNILPLLEKFKKGDLEKTLLPELAKRGELVWYREREGAFWASVDTLKDLEEVRKAFPQLSEKTSV